MIASALLYTVIVNAVGISTYMRIPTSHGFATVKDSVTGVPAFAIFRDGSFSDVMAALTDDGLNAAVPAKSKNASRKQVVFLSKFFIRLPFCNNLVFCEQILITCTLFSIANMGF